MIILDHLIQTIRSASIYNPEAQAAPACILWPDRDRQWEAVIPRLQHELPELLVLGEYAPEQRTGPAIWLRCVIAGQFDDISLPNGCTPVIYLPGISRQDLRIVENCSNYLKPLIELQYRGVIWSQISFKDWTILAYLKSDQGGLGLDVAQDGESKNAMQSALQRLLDVDIDLLQGKRLDRDYFNSLLTGGDPVRDLLLWLDHGDSFQTSRDEVEWQAFIEVCVSQFAFNPQKAGALSGVALLAGQEGPWLAVWERFCEAPSRYPNIPSQIRKCPQPDFDLFSDAATAGGWPQWNEQQEKALTMELNTLSDMPAHEARNRIMEFDKQHACRRGLIWAELNESPLVRALEYLVLLAEITKKNLAAGTIADLSSGYCNQGWKADDAVMRALYYAKNSSDYNAISSAINSVYLSWAEESAQYLQKLVDETSYPGGSHLTTLMPSYIEGECILFVDGLRFDTGKRLAGMLEQTGLNVIETPTWVALPSVTATGKAAVTPVADKIKGQDSNIDFTPEVAATGQSLKSGHHLKKLLTEANWSILPRTKNGDGTGNAWSEVGDIDHEGHDRGWKLSKHIDIILKEVLERITALIDAGWQRVQVVTDHGWLLLPGGLPKTNLPGCLTDSKWGRCAVLKPGASSEDRLYPWFWNPNQFFALADGIRCFKIGQEYTHGGLSLQECLTLQLTVSRDAVSKTSVLLDATSVIWKGLRCTVSVEDNISGLMLDIRKEAGNKLSSLITIVKPFKDNGKVSVIVEDVDMEGKIATIVIMNQDGDLVTQLTTIIGGKQ